MFTTVNDINII